MTKAVITPTTPDDIKRRLPAVPASLDARFAPAVQRIAVTFAKPVDNGRPEKITGDLLCTPAAKCINTALLQAACSGWCRPFGSRPRRVRR